MNEPIHIISLGAGVQSSTMALMAAHGEITPMPKCAIFADTQDEPEAVYEWLYWLTKQLPFPVRRVSQGSLKQRSLTPYWSKKNKKMTVVGIPAHTKDGIMMRQCTSEFKTNPISVQITREMRESGTRKAVKWLGISLDEIHRMKPSRRASVDHRWPLIDMRIKRGACLEWMKRHGYPEPPKSACIYCPYQPNRQWQSLTKEEFSSALIFEKELQAVYAKIGLPEPFLHFSKKSLNEVDFSTDEDHGQQVMFGNECEGMCGV